MMQEEIDKYINSHFSEGVDGGMISDQHKEIGGVTYSDLVELAQYFIDTREMNYERKGNI